MLLLVMMLYRLQEGPCTKSFGIIHVARTADFPAEVIADGGSTKSNRIRKTYMHITSHQEVDEAVNLQSKFNYLYIYIYILIIVLIVTIIDHVVFNRSPKASSYPRIFR